MTHIIKTNDGSYSIYSNTFNEYYHSIHGALQESLYVFIKQGLFQLKKKSKIKLFECGFGTGLNAALTLHYVNNKQIILYESIEKYPLSIKRKKEYYHKTKKKYKKYLQKLSSAPWNIPYSLSETFTIKKINDDILNYPFPSDIDLIYFDAFSPNHQPELWSKRLLQTCYTSQSNGGIFVTYCAKGEIKRRLKECGYTVQTLPGPPNKREMIRAIK